MAKDRIEDIASLQQQVYEELLANLIVHFYRPGFDTLLLNLRDKNRLSLMRFIVMLNAKFKAIGKIVPLLKIGGQSIETQGGFLLSNGEETIDCTLETLLKEHKAILLEAMR